MKQNTLHVSDCRQCPFRWDNTEYPESICQADNHYIYPESYQGPPLADCPLRTTEFLVKLETPFP